MTPATVGGARALVEHRFTAFGGAACVILASRCDDAALSAAVAEVYAFEARLTRFDAGSELSRLNAAAPGMAVTPLLEELLVTALDAYVLSDGLVNAAVLPALIAAGYDATIATVRVRSAGVAAAAAPPVPALPDVLEVGGGWARVRPGAAVDLGGVGKGWLADRLAERLDDALVSLGGDLRACGCGPDGAGWPVQLCDGAVVRVRDAGVATSGTAARRWAGGHHLVDPRTGRPADSDVAAVSVVAPSALRAEVLAKACVIMGSAAGPEFAVARGALRVAAAPGEART